MPLDLGPLIQMLQAQGMTPGRRAPSGIGRSTSPPLFVSSPQGVNVGTASGSRTSSGPIVPVSSAGPVSPSPRPSLPTTAPQLFADPTIGGDTAGTGTTGPGDTSVAGMLALDNALNPPASQNIGVGPFSFSFPRSTDQAALAISKGLVSATPVSFPLGALYSLALHGVNVANRANINAAPRAFSGGADDPTTDLSDLDLSVNPDIGLVPSSVAANNPGVPGGASSVASNPGQVGLTAAGGLIGGVGGPPGGMANVDNNATVNTTNVVEGPPGGAAGVGAAGPSSSGSVSAGLTAGEVGVAGSGAGSGGDAGGGPCFLASFGMEALAPEERRIAKRFFQDFLRLFLKENPNGKELFAKYQAVAKRIIEKIRMAGPETEKKEQAFIYKRLIKPTGIHIEQKEVDQAVRNLQSVVTTLARRYDVPLPAGRS